MIDEDLIDRENIDDIEIDIPRTITLVAPPPIPPLPVIEELPEENIEFSSIETDTIKPDTVVIKEKKITDPLAQGEEEEEIIKDYVLSNIDLSHWKVTLPIGNPTEVLPPEILKYATNETLKPFMYNDSVKGALVFYTYPGSTTTNSSYSRTELREQMVAGSNSTNWTFAKGGNLKGELAK